MALRSLKCRFCSYFVDSSHSDTTQRHLMMIHIGKEHFESVCKRN